MSRKGYSAAEEAKAASAKVKREKQKVALILKEEKDRIAKVVKVAAKVAAIEIEPIVIKRTFFRNIYEQLKTYFHE